MFLYLLCDQNTSRTIHSWFSHLIHWMNMEQLNLLFSTSLKSLHLPFEDHKDVDLEIQAPSLAGLDVSTVPHAPLSPLFLLDTIFLVPLACRLETTTWKLTRKSGLQPQLILVSGSQQQLIFFFRLLQTLETNPSGSSVYVDEVWVYIPRIMTYAERASLESWYDVGSNGWPSESVNFGYASPCISGWVIFWIILSLSCFLKWQKPQSCKISSWRFEQLFNIQQSQ